MKSKIDNHVLEHELKNKKLINYVLPQCKNVGEKTKTCREDCSLDGSTCTMTIHLDDCTCNGIHILLTEEAKYNLALDTLISTNSTSDLTYGTGYSKECGTCLKFCSRFHGEKQRHKDSTKHQCLK